MDIGKTGSSSIGKRAKTKSRPYPNPKSPAFQPGFFVVEVNIEAHEIRGSVQN
jgi:hypothetical protein